MTKEITYEIKGPCGNDREVTGVKLTEHLSAHDGGGYWVLDHTASGLRVLSAGTLDVALVVANELEPRIDWDNLETDPHKTSGNRDTIPPEVKAYIRAIDGSHRAWKIGEDRPKPPKVSIIIDVSGSSTFSAGDIWPDGDWPDVIDEAAVRKVLKETGDTMRVIDEWNLNPDIEVAVYENGRAKR